MAKRIVFPLRRLPQLSRDEFQAYWFDVHGPLVASYASTLGIVRYQQVHTLHETRPTTVACFDGVAELWVDPARRSADVGAVVAASNHLLEDEHTFIDHAASPIWIADEDVRLVDDIDRSSRGPGHAWVANTGDGLTVTRTAVPGDRCSTSAAGTCATTSVPSGNPTCTRPSEPAAVAPGSSVSPLM